MEDQQRKFWFPLNANGPGWSWPCRWQGWAVLVLIVLAATGITLYVPRGSASFYAGLVALLVAVRVVFRLKGEPRAPK